MIHNEPDGYWIELTETIAAHHEEVFACLTTDAGLSRWFPITANVDLRTGGTIEFGWDAKATRKTTIAIIHYDAGGEITWDWYAGLDDRHAPLYWKVAPSVEQGATITLRQGPFAEETDALIAMAEQASTWRWHLCNLRSALEARHDMRNIRPL